MTHIENGGIVIIRRANRDQGVIFKRAKERAKSLPEVTSWLGLSLRSPLHTSTTSLVETRKPFHTFNQHKDLQVDHAAPVFV